MNSRTEIIKSGIFVNGRWVFSLNGLVFNKLLMRKTVGGVYIVNKKCLVKLIGPCK